jgi:hypothetical protein
MMKPVRTISIITSLLWATAIISSAIIKPSFFTLMLLPMLGFASLATIVTIGRRMDVSGI